MTRGRFSEETRNLVLRRSSGVCERCHAMPVQEIHHRIPRGMGGVKGRHADVVESPANALGLCRRCHEWAERGDRRVARDQGIILRRTADPTKAPFFAPGHRQQWLILDSEGNRHPYSGPWAGGGVSK